MNGPALLAAGRVSLAHDTTLLLKDGTHEFRTGARFLGAGTVRKAGPGGEITGSGPVTLGPRVTWSFDAGMLHGKFTVTGGGAFVWSNGTAVAPITVAEDSRMQLTGAAAKTMHGTLVNNGALTWQARRNLRDTARGRRYVQADHLRAPQRTLQPPAQPRRTDLARQLPRHIRHRSRQLNPA